PGHPGRVAGGGEPGDDVHLLPPGPPPRRDPDVVQNFPAYRGPVEPEEQVHHVVLVTVPQGRAADRQRGGAVHDEVVIIRKRSRHENLPPNCQQTWVLCPGPSGAVAGVCTSRKRAGHGMRGGGREVADGHFASETAMPIGSSWISHVWKGV